MTRPITLMMASALTAALTACTTAAAAPPGAAGASSGTAAAQAGTSTTAGDLQRQIARFAPTDLSADVSALPEPERKALTAMLRAAQIMDALFLRQVWAGNEGVLFQLLARLVAGRAGAAARIS